MKLLVFGATGKIGQHLMDQALKLGHDVTAFVRNPKKLRQSHKNLRTIQGDVLDPSSVTDALEGHDAVLCALGTPIHDKQGLRAKGTKIIADAMEETGVRRLICLSGFGAGDSRDLLPFHYKYLIFPFLLNNVFADHEDQETFVRNSSLDWTLVRPGNFTKGKHTGRYQHGFTAMDKSIKLKISHEDVADFMLWQLAEDVYVHKTPALSY